ncbi:hypothetical protein VP01_832g4 [Puccinia sorghi]|uniref:Uncharacterized protein n=1 Tax=Puccinia sorghi TaxID=27349 RepID=A0A0L6UBR7_9BASI|nr:hypothetical protein VP01_832g4 [Puccinia sorghi]
MAEIKTNWTTDQIIHLRAILHTQTKIQADWHWHKAMADLCILSELLNLKMEPYEEPSAAIQSSGLMDHEPNRSIQAQSQLIPLFHHHHQTNDPQAAPSQREYPASISNPARFLFSHLPGFNTHLHRNISRLEASHPAIFNLILEFSKVYQVRLLIYHICISDWAFERLLAWDQSLKTVESSPKKKEKKNPSFDDEPDRFLKAKELFDHELARE